MMKCSNIVKRRRQGPKIWPYIVNKTTCFNESGTDIALLVQVELAVTSDDLVWLIGRHRRVHADFSCVKRPKIGVGRLL